ncbi:hypothetical protein ACIBK8_21485 [Streptomyces sp. NPDC050161]|uniref:hypothetical protein n=1 Tax=Streptomyces sp. NPDC050161 TaxID=3365604 RepID=UPI0037B91D8A
MGGTHGWDFAERAGHNTVTLLAKAAAQRELGSADSISDVLVWRLHHLGYVTPPVSVPRVQPPHSSPVAGPVAAVRQGVPRQQRR